MTRHSTCHSRPPRPSPRDNRLGSSTGRDDGEKSRFDSIHPVVVPCPWSEVSPLREIPQWTGIVGVGPQTTDGWVLGPVRLTISFSVVKSFIKGKKTNRGEDIEDLVHRNPHKPSTVEMLPSLRQTKQTKP